MDRSERIGLGVSATVHALLIATLALGLLHWSAPDALTPPSFEVALTDNIALESLASSQEEPQVAQAPDLGPSDPDTVPPAQAVAQPQPQPKPVPRPAASPQPAKLDRSKPDPGKATPAKTPAEKTRPPRAGILGDVLKGLDAPAKSPATSTAESGNAPLSAEAARALSAELRRQLKPYWRAPTGVDADKLITMLRWRLNPDGTLSASPALASQTGKTASNQPQQQLHIEAAIRAVRAAAPFRLPSDYYDNWKLIEFSFDKRL